MDALKAAFKFMVASTLIVGGVLVAGTVFAEGVVFCDPHLYCQNDHTQGKLVQLAPECVCQHNNELCIYRYTPNISVQLD